MNLHDEPRLVFGDVARYLQEGLAQNVRCAALNDGVDRLPLGGAAVAERRVSGVEASRCRSDG